MEIEASAAAATGAKVLVIDDSNTIRRSAEIFLRQGGHEVVLAETHEKVRCRWCGASGTIEMISRPDALPGDGEARPQG